MASTAKHDWPMVRLGDVCEVVSGGTPKTSVEEYWGGEIPWVTPADLSKLKGLEISSGERAITQRGVDKSSAVLLPAGSVVLSSRAPIGYVAIAQVPMATNQGCKSFIPSSEVDSRYLAHYLLSQKDALQSLGTGATFKELSKSRAADILIPLPPLDEQRRIAAMLDEVDDALARVKQSLGDLLQLKQELFTDLFLRMERESTAIGEYLESTQYGTSDKANENVGIPVLRMGNVSYNGEIELSDLKYVELDIKDREKYSLKAGDLLFNRTNSKDLVGKTAVVPALPEEYTYAGYLIRCRVNDKAVPEYISGYLNSVLGKKILRNTAKAIVGMANINANELKRLPIPKASLDEQQEFASSTSRIEDVESQMKRQRKLLQELQESLSIRAFQGEL
ncbi:restriction endonuclease subunit S [Corynebacterium sp. HMSC068H04]|uniref:restriction endonuclease subunit S n=1 Tax=Corynebacterium sp. HMSC068H04 TaxID=1739296 RepID=UPI0009F3877A|nr:restriction endonuclease subunit S [Corynebacterium sp. HMSC068H04]